MTKKRKNTINRQRSDARKKKQGLARKKFAQMREF